MSNEPPIPLLLSDQLDGMDAELMLLQKAIAATDPARELEIRCEDMAKSLRGIRKTVAGLHPTPDTSLLAKIEDDLYKEASGIDSEHWETIRITAALAIIQDHFLDVAQKVGDDHIVDAHKKVHRVGGGDKTMDWDKCECPLIAFADGVHRHQFHADCKGVSNGQPAEMVERAEKAMQAVVDDQEIVVSRDFMRHWEALRTRLAKAAAGVCSEMPLTELTTVAAYAGARDSSSTRLEGETPENGPNEPTPAPATDEQGRPMSYWGGLAAPASPQTSSVENQASPQVLETAEMRTNGQPDDWRSVVVTPGSNGNTVSFTVKAAGQSNEETCEGCIGQEAEMNEILRVARDNPTDLVNFLRLNYPKEMSLSKEQHLALFESSLEREANAPVTISAQEYRHLNALARANRAVYAKYGDVLRDGFKPPMREFRRDVDALVEKSPDIVQRVIQAMKDGRNAKGDTLLEMYANSALSVVTEAQWQPIETAPKDTPFLAYVSVGARARLCVLRYSPPEDEGGNAHSYRSPDGAWYGKDTVTYWMPLPQPPEQPRRG